MLDPDMPDQEMRLHMGELSAQEMRAARAAIRWANSVAMREPEPLLSQEEAAQRLMAIARMFREHARERLEAKHD